MQHDRNGEDNVCCPCGVRETTTLLRDTCGQRAKPERPLQQPRSLCMDREMVHIAIQIQHKIQVKKCNQAIGHHRLDRTNHSRTPHSANNLDNSLWWRKVSCGGRSCSCHYCTIRDQIQIRSSPQLFPWHRLMHQQHSKVWSYEIRPMQAQDSRSQDVHRQDRLKDCSRTNRKDCTAKELVLLLYLSAVRSLEKNVFDGWPLSISTETKMMKPAHWRRWQPGETHYPLAFSIE